MPVSTVDAELEIAEAPVQDDGLDVTEAREARVGDMTVRRLLPLRLRRSVGAWCFVDHYGPMSVDGVAVMRVPPHPHIGLQTVTWLISGNVLHRDSLGRSRRPWPTGGRDGSRRSPITTARRWPRRRWTPSG
jgi:quercetin 2,3-dioxygenase